MATVGHRTLGKPEFAGHMGHTLLYSVRWRSKKSWRLVTFGVSYTIPLQNGKAH
jgi:hypothetical protein